MLGDDSESTWSDLLFSRDTSVLIHTLLISNHIDGPIGNQRPVIRRCPPPNRHFRRPREAVTLKVGGVDMNAAYRNSGRDLEGIATEAGPPYSGERGLIRMLPWCSKLRNIIRPGSVLVYARMIRLPSELILEGWPFGRWSILGGVNGWKLEGALRSRGWHFRRWKTLARWGWRFSHYGALACALQKIVRHAENDYRNTVEIKDVSSGRIFGLHLVRVSAEPATVYWSREHVAHRQAA